MKKTNIILILIILLQIVFKIYVDYNKEDFYIDEIYSYGLMNYKQAFIFEEPTFLENWHDQKYFDDYGIAKLKNKDWIEIEYKN